MSNIPQHKRLAMGEKVGFKAGGSVPPKVWSKETGLEESPLTKVKRANGVPGMRKGGKADGKCGC